MVVLATKVSNPAREEHEMNREFTPNERGSNRKYIIQAVDGCLRRLRTDRIDVLYLHQLRDRLNVMLARESRTEIAQSCFDFLPTRAALDLAGWEETDIFAHS